MQAYILRLEEKADQMFVRVAVTLSTIKPGNVQIYPPVAENVTSQLIRLLV